MKNLPKNSKIGAFVLLVVLAVALCLVFQSFIPLVIIWPVAGLVGYFVEDEFLDHCKTIKPLLLAPIFGFFYLLFSIAGQLQREEQS